MKSKKLIVLMWIFALLPAVMLALCWGSLPAQVPTNWGFNGQVAYSAKSTLWIVAAVGPAVAALLQLMPRIDPKKENYRKFQGAYDGVAVGIILFFALVVAMVLVESLRPGTVVVSRVVTALVCVLFVGLGCIMGKVKTNWFMGIRTPWTLSDPDVWNKTHRMGGWVFFLSGAVTLVLSFLAPERLILAVTLITILGGMVLTVVMSFLWYKAKQSGKE